MGDFSAPSILEVLTKNYAGFLVGRTLSKLSPSLVLPYVPLSERLPHLV